MLSMSRSITQSPQLLMTFCCEVCGQMLSNPTNAATDNSVIKAGVACGAINPDMVLGETCPKCGKVKLDVTRTIWSTLAEDKSLDQAADEFAQRYFKKPKRRSLTDRFGRFRVYRVRHKYMVVRVRESVLDGGAWTYRILQLN